MLRVLGFVGFVGFKGFVGFIGLRLSGAVELQVSTPQGSPPAPPALLMMRTFGN